MSIINLIKTSIYSLKSHKLRVFLTMIGIIIGISSVVTILSIGDGLKAHVNKSVESSNANKINVYFHSNNTDVDINLIEPFTSSDITSLQKIEGVQKVEVSKGIAVGFDFTASQAKYFDKNVMIFLDSYQDKTLDIEYGRKFNYGEDNKRQIVLDSDIAKELFKDPKDSIGKGLTINDLTYEIIGVLKPAGSFSFTNGISYISKNFKDSVNTSENINTLDVYVKPNYDKTEVFSEVQSNLAQSHATLDGEYKMEDPEAITKTFEEIIGGLTTFVALVSGISLFVGGIGVMNIMYVSVSERKREIGIRRAIGAKPKSILLQFLFESILVTCTGGLLGIFFGFLFSKIVGAFLPFPPVLTLKSFIGSTITSVLVGIIFGIIPAYNASKLDPIKAIYK
ncbi:ABC transporter permease [Clostridium senegalense]|uniref:ABC transporter permease n=1 Tax=Clostridium senegalense TaxID=1465809 RepID=UPI001C0F5FE6|nr:ABC transporter permease [Clostridium senegalense]MBU5227291.1 ABC transporter permease [Clostridium senegalense]